MSEVVEETKPISRGHGGPRPNSGRPRDEDKRTVSEMAKKYTALAVRTLVKIAKKSDSDAARVAAANALLNRGWGLPMQNVTVEATVKGALYWANRMKELEHVEVLQIEHVARDEKDQEVGDGTDGNA